VSTPLQAETHSWNGLRKLEAALPASWYFDATQHELELHKIWYRNWIYVCRADQLTEPLGYVTHRIGTQTALVLRDESGELRAFHNTCRHRGSALCLESAGRLPTRAITCRYHGWSYNLRGELLRTPAFGRPEPAGLRELGLYGIQLRNWNGFVFINLSPTDQRPLETGFIGGADTLRHWPLADLKVGHSHSRTLRSNWKIFWENYNECLHCAGVHPALSRMVPIYRRGILEERDDPNWAAHQGSTDPSLRGGLRAGAVTWSMNGKACGPEFSNLSAEERRVGYHYLTHLPSMYVAGHVDYVRVVRLQPLGPDSTEVFTQWLFPAQTLAAPDFDLHNTVDFGAGVMAEDAEICELAQQGQHALMHRAGVLMPEEYDVFNFQQWVRAELAR
jgi:glycine betaine catabolism A